MKDARKHIESIYSAAIRAVDPASAVESHVMVQGGELVLMSSGTEQQRIDLESFDKIFVVGAGKATSPMAAAVEKLLGSRISSGAICVKYGYGQNLSRISLCEAAHPIPDEKGESGARMIIDILKQAGKNDLVLSLISGGGSALLPLPPDGISLEEKRRTTDLLLKSGASIHEMNAVRKHLSMIKGGNMAVAAYPATVINLMISDVVGDDMDVIASGPFVPDNSRFSDAAAILEKYSLTEKVPGTVMEYILSGVNGTVRENPGADHPAFSGITNMIVASNIQALQAAKSEADRLGYNTMILSSMIEGETADAAMWHTRVAREVRMSGNPVKAPACIISGGETTVTIKGDGLGGRNMEFALCSAMYLEGTDGIYAASVGTDGTDGPTDAAGAVADSDTVRRAADMGIDTLAYANNNDSYNFFKRLGDLVITGPTNTNVMDVRIMLIT